MDRLSTLCNVVGTAVVSCSLLASAVWTFKRLTPTPDLAKTYKTVEKNKWALVTGATSGIGREFAIKLAELGFNLLIISRNEQKMKETCTELASKYGIKTNFFSVDFEQFPNGKMTVEKFSTEVRKKISGELCLLICNAGMSDLAYHFTDIPFERQQRLMNLNMVANVAIIQSLIPQLLKDHVDKTRAKPGIITLGAMTALSPAPILAMSSGIKSFVRNFTISIRREFKGYINITCAHPMAVWSGIVKEKNLISAITARKFVEGSLSAFAKGRNETCGCVTHDIGLTFIDNLLPRWILMEWFIAYADDMSAVINRPINKRNILEKLKIQ